MSTNPVDNEELYRSIVLAGRASPGQVTLSGHDDKTGWDVKSASAQKGASMSRKKKDPTEFEAAFYLVKDIAEGVDDYAEWPAFRDLINSTVSGKEPKALDVYHPDLAEQGITSVVKGTVCGRTYDGKGGCTIRVKFLEYLPPEKTGGGVAAVKTSPRRDDPDAAALAELARLTEQYKETPWG